jgi:hypothetical protein
MIQPFQTVFHLVNQTVFAFVSIFTASQQIQANREPTHNLHNTKAKLHASL